MHVGILGGTGPAGGGLALRLASAGIDVVIGSRSAERAEAHVAELLAKWPDRKLSLRGADNAEAASAEIVVVATPWEGAASTAAQVSEHLQGKVVISMANALAKVGDEWQPLVSARGSVALAVQTSVRGARVAAAFQHLPAKELGDLDHTLEADVLVCSDEQSATDTTIELISKVPGLRGLDAGKLANAGALEAMVAVLLEVNVRYKTRASLRVTGV